MECIALHCIDETKTNNLTGEDREGFPKFMLTSRALTPAAHPEPIYSTYYTNLIKVHVICFLSVRLKRNLNDKPDIVYHRAAIV